MYALKDKVFFLEHTMSLFYRAPPFVWKQAKSLAMVDQLANPGREVGPCNTKVAIEGSVSSQGNIHGLTF